jgi:hypothetical protein
MGALRYRDGGVTVTLSGDLLTGVDAAIRRAMGGALEVMETEAEAVARKARAAWYGADGVTRRTGKSGDIQPITTIDAAKQEVRVGVGSTDTRTAGRKPVWVFVHRPAPTSAIQVEVGRAEYFATPDALKARYPFVWKPNPGASDGKNLMAVYIRAPIKAALPAVAAAVGKLVTARLG